MQNHTAKIAKKTFIERALEQILADKDISRSHHLQLKKACESALGTLFLEFQSKVFVIDSEFLSHLVGVEPRLIMSTSFIF